MFPYVSTIMYLVSLGIDMSSISLIGCLLCIVGRPQRPYDLLWPVARRRTFAVEPGAKVTEEFGRHTKAPTAAMSPTSPPTNLGTFEDLRDYARRLLSSFQNSVAPGVPMKLPAEVFSPVRSDLERELEREVEGGLTGCREAVEILTRNPKKGLYVTLDLFRK
jgi:RAB6A-GEF complex partner protein 2